jgi:hypothetical protein
MEDHGREAATFEMAAEAPAREGALIYAASPASLALTVSRKGERGNEQDQFA